VGDIACPSVLSLTGGRSLPDVILGDLLIILGQLSNAIQMIIEEVFLKRRKV